MGHLPYVLTGLAVILVFWSRSLLHTLSFIGWPLEFGHTFGYFAATLVEAAALSQVGDHALVRAQHALCQLRLGPLRLGPAAGPSACGRFQHPGARALLDDSSATSGSTSAC